VQCKTNKIANACGMSVKAMAAVTLIILAEKTLPWPRLAPYAAAVVLVLYGALMVVAPGLSAVFGIFGRGEVEALDHSGLR
jgi:hypothetical protein